MFSTVTLLHSIRSRKCFRHPTPLAQILLHARKKMQFVTLKVVISSLSVPECLSKEKKREKKAEDFY